MISMLSWLQLFIDGKFVDAHGGATMDAVNTRTGKAMATVAAAQPADVDAAVQAARQAFDAGRWPRMTGKARTSSSACGMPCALPALQRTARPLSWRGCLSCTVLPRLHFVVDHN